MDEIVSLHQHERHADVETHIQSVVEFLNLNKTKVTR